jgi:putative hemolysin
MAIHRLYTPVHNASQCGSLSVSMALGADEIHETLRLRHQVFIEEMGVNLRPRANAVEEDEFDQYCRHILVRDDLTGKVVGTTRLLLQDDAVLAGMFITETCFELEQVLSLPGRFMEIGRLCIHADYRQGDVLYLLWAAIVQQMLAHDIDHVLACVSLPMDEDGAYARALITQLPARHFTPRDLRATPRLPLPKRQAAMTLPLTKPASLLASLRRGALVCGDCCWNPVFDCAEVLMLAHRSQLAPRRPARRVLRQGGQLVAAG